LTFALRLAVALVAPVEPAWDGFFYARLAEALHDGHGYANVLDGRVQATAFYPVGYPAAMALLMALCRSARFAALAVNLLASMVATVCVVLTTRRAAGDVAAWRAGLIAAIYPGAVLWSGAAMTETLTGALLAMAMLAATSSRRGAAAVGGVTLGLATLVRPQSLLAVPLVALARTRGLRRTMVAFVLALATAGLVVAPWTLRNCRRLDACALVSTNGGSNLLIGTFADAYGGYRRPSAADGCTTVRGEVARDRCMSREAMRRIDAHTALWLKLTVLKLTITFAWEHDPVSYLGASWPRPLRYALIALCTAAWWALVAFAWRGTARVSGDADTALARWALGLFAVTAFTHGVFLGADRYHLLLVPSLAPLAAMGSLSWRAP
jgi:4-amino-4-deoxy-L-arabinose transferase-like glycosyltransferase